MPLTIDGLEEGLPTHLDELIIFEGDTIKARLTNGTEVLIHRADTETIVIISPDGIRVRSYFDSHEEVQKVLDPNPQVTIFVGKEPLRLTEKEQGLLKFLLEKTPQPTLQTVLDMDACDSIPIVHDLARKLRAGHAQMQVLNRHMGYGNLEWKSMPREE